MTEDTIVQIRDEKGDWTDYSRTTRPEALAAVTAGILPGHSRPEPLRAVDWISKEEIAVTETKTLTPKDLAEKLSTDSKTVRRFLRKAHGDDAPGQGGRWAIQAAQVAKLRKEFETWQKAEEERRAKAAKELADAKDQTAEVIDAQTKPTEPREQDAVDAAQAKGSLPKSEATKAAQAKARKAARAAAQPKPEAETKSPTA